MKKYLKKIGLVIAVILVIVAVILGAYLYRSNQEATLFTQELNALEEKGPEVVVSTSDINENNVSQDVSEIQSLLALHYQAWCEGNGAAYAAGFAENADFISFDGTHTIGRGNIDSSHQELFDSFLKNTCLRGYIERIKFVNEDTAIVYVKSGTRFDGKETVQRPSIQTYVAVKQDDAWLFSSFHNGRIDLVDDRNILRKIWLGIQTVIFRR